MAETVSLRYRPQVKTGLGPDEHIVLPTRCKVARKLGKSVCIIGQETVLPLLNARACRRAALMTWGASPFHQSGTGTDWGNSFFTAQPGNQLFFSSVSSSSFNSNHWWAWRGMGYITSWWIGFLDPSPLHEETTDIFHCFLPSSTCWCTSQSALSRREKAPRSYGDSPWQPQKPVDIR